VIKLTLMVFLIIAGIVMTEESVLPIPVRDILLGIVALVIICWPLNDEGVQWLIAELQAKTRNPPYAEAKVGGVEQQTDWESIELGDFICTAEEHARLESARDQADGASPPNLLYYYFRVIAKFIPADGGRMRIVVFGRQQPYEVRPGTEFHDCAVAVKPGKSAKPIDRSAAALADLLGILPEDRQAVREDAVIGWLVTDRKHRPGTVRLALRIALVAGLAVRDRHGLDRLRYIRETGRIFQAGTPVTGHASCHLSLTESGMYWRRAGTAGTTPAVPDTDTVPPFVGTYVSNQHNVVIGNHNSVGNIGSHAQYVVNPDIGQLAAELAQLRVVLTWQPSGPEYALAISCITEALRAAQQGDEQDTMKQLSRLRTLSTDVGKWVLSTATAVGAQLLVTVLKQVLHLPSVK